MRDIKIECGTHNVNDIIVAMPCEGCLTWCSGKETEELVFALVHCSTFINWGIIRHLKFVWERFPLESSERGIYYYVIFEGRYNTRCVIHQIKEQSVLLPIESGPAVLDFPIVSPQAIEDSVGLQQYISSLQCKKFGVISREKLFRLYDLAYTQSKSFSPDLAQYMLWYTKSLEKVRMTYKRLIESASGEAG